MSVLTFHCYRPCKKNSFTRKIDKKFVINNQIIDKKIDKKKIDIKKFDIKKIAIPLLSTNQTSPISCPHLCCCGDSGLSHQRCDESGCYSRFGDLCLQQQFFSTRHIFLARSRNLMRRFQRYLLKFIKNYLLLKGADCCMIFKV